MSLNTFLFAVIKKLIVPNDKDVIGDDSVLAVAENYRSSGGELDIYAVRKSLIPVLKEGDLVVCDISLECVPNTTVAAPRKEVIKIIRNETKATLEAIYKDKEQKASKGETRPSPVS